MTHTQTHTSSAYSLDTTTKYIIVINFGYDIYLFINLPSLTIAYKVNLNLFRLTWEMQPNLPAMFHPLPSWLMILPYNFFLAVAHMDSVLSAKRTLRIWLPSLHPFLSHYFWYPLSCFHLGSSTSPKVQTASKVFGGHVRTSCVSISSPAVWLRTHWFLCLCLSFLICKMCIILILA